jgi:hypothetical protein
MEFKLVKMCFLQHHIVHNTLSSEVDRQWLDYVDYNLWTNSVGWIDDD